MMWKRVTHQQGAAQRRAEPAVAAGVDVGTAFVVAAAQTVPEKAFTCFELCFV